MQQYTVTKSEKFLHRGFTLMEVMVSVSIFTIIMVIGISSLLTINISNSQSRSDREAMDKVSFLLESMTRKIRTGTIDPGSTSSHLTFTNQFGDIEEYEFIGGSQNPLVYRFLKCNPQSGGICNWSTLEEYNIAPDGDLVTLDSVSFDIFGEGPTANDDLEQALVIIRMRGTASEKHQQTPFAIQTAVSQRQLQL